MSRNLADYRKSYEKGVLTENAIASSPFQQFEQWFTAAQISEAIDEANAMTLTTLDAQGFPKGRVVLLKEYSKEGFVFYTNYTSEKGKAIAHHNKVSISFFWPALERQIIIKGVATKVSDEKSTAYFKSRPRASQLGALVSDQSSIIANRDALQKKMETIEKEYEEQEIPKPKDWGGYIIKPISFEFWQGRKSRLHDRIEYVEENKIWVSRRLQP